MSQVGYTFSVIFQLITYGHLGCLAQAPTCDELGVRLHWLRCYNHENINKCKFCFFPPALASLMGAYRPPARTLLHLLPYRGLQSRKVCSDSSMCSTKGWTSICSPVSSMMTANIFPQMRSPCLTSLSFKSPPSWRTFGLNLRRMTAIPVRLTNHPIIGSTALSVPTLKDLTKRERHMMS